MRAILDSGLLVALWRKQDEHKEWAIDLLRKFTGPFYVTELVLAEVSHMTGRERDIIAGLKNGRFILGADLVEDLETIDRCCSTYSQCDLADASIVAASERFPRLQVLTTDRKHFRTYRRGDGSPLPLVIPG